MPRSSLNLSNNAPIENGRKQSNKIFRHGRSIAIVTQKSSCGRRNQERLTGGADNAVAEEVPETTDVNAHPSQVTVSHAEENDEEASESKTEGFSPPAGPCCFCVSKTPTSTGNKKLDEMFDYVQQNLQEAGRALATLSENFEHEFKLMLVDILGRIQQWSGVAQNKLDTCKNEVESLRKELLSRLCELSEKEAQLLEKEQEIMRKEQEIATLKDLLRERSIVSKKGESKVSYFAPGSKSESRAFGSRPVSVTKQSESRILVDSSSKIERLNDSATLEHGPSATIEGYYEELVTSDDIQEGDYTSPVQTPRETVDRSRPGTTTHSITQADVGIVTCTIETTRHEAELEAELLRLRQENERIIKERTDYENAIQRALLRGVSSLNVETLKVLRSPPIYCAPCAPSSAPPDSRTEPIVPCKSAKASSASKKLKTCTNTKRNDSDKYISGEQSKGSTKSPCGSPGCSARKTRKCTSNSLLFLLHQTDPVSTCLKDRDKRTIPLFCPPSNTAKGDTLICTKFKRQL